MQRYGSNPALAKHNTDSDCISGRALHPIEWQNPAGMTIDFSPLLYADRGVQAFNTSLVSLKQTKILPSSNELQHIWQRQKGATTSLHLGT